ncbi:hypothetical protein J6590_062739 [Homalodisca vitripennis]|nr:hypothetical protein J6590_062739 [Homalodisca vitripennis]
MWGRRTGQYCASLILHVAIDCSPHRRHEFSRYHKQRLGYNGLGDPNDTILSFSNYRCLARVLPRMQRRALPSIVYHRYCTWRSIVCTPHRRHEVSRYQQPSLLGQSINPDAATCTAQYCVSPILHVAIDCLYAASTARVRCTLKLCLKLVSTADHTAEKSKTTKGELPCRVRRCLIDGCRDDDVTWWRARESCLIPRDTRVSRLHPSGGERPPPNPAPSPATSLHGPSLN